MQQLDALRQLLAISVWSSVLRRGFGVERPVACLLATFAASSSGDFRFVAGGRLGPARLLAPRVPVLQLRRRAHRRSSSSPIEALAPNGCALSSFRPSARRTARMNEVLVSCASSDCLSSHCVLRAPLRSSSRSICARARAARWRRAARRRRSARRSAAVTRRPRRRSASRRLDIARSSTRTIGGRIRTGEAAGTPRPRRGSPRRARRAETLRASAAGTPRTRIRERETDWARRAAAIRRSRACSESRR